MICKKAKIPQITKLGILDKINLEIIMIILLGVSE
jgi:hypothetical protein